MSEGPRGGGARAAEAGVGRRPSGSPRETGRDGAPSCAARRGRPGCRGGHGSLHGPDEAPRHLAAPPSCADGLGRARAPPLCVLEIRIRAYRWELHSGPRRPAPAPGCRPPARAALRPLARRSGDVAEVLAPRQTLCEELKQLLSFGRSRWFPRACVPQCLLHPPTPWPGSFSLFRGWCGAEVRAEL